MIKFKLANGIEVIPTSFHGCRFSDGTEFAPTAEDIEQIKADWPADSVRRDFMRADDPLPGIGASRSIQTPSQDIMDRLDKAQADNPNAIVLVSFMLASALAESGLRGRFPRVLAANATKETSRSAPQDKVWDIQNFSAI
ncbi:MAG: hypothetical protein RBT04_10900 [Sphaerochaetaceae bacterium]|jgi:hypothetical protein|nr:hypothetical protein [Sphaerochaetaceae bacterium]